MPGSVPSGRWGSGRSALADLLGRASSVRAAVAFVTQGGVDVLADLLGDEAAANTRLEIVARGAPITDPDALIRLHDDLGARVSVITGEHARLFHPKLWLLEADDKELSVFSGSGNLTSRGLDGNREQFEVLSLVGKEADAQRERFDHLTAGAIPLKTFEGSIAWRTWRRNEKRRRELTDKIRELDREVEQSHAINRDPDKAALKRDLWGLYDLMVAERLKDLQDKTYIPSGFRLGLQGFRGPDEPVRIASSLCREETDGFRELCRLDRLDLAVESLVADSAKPYFTLFSEKIRNAAAARLEDAVEGGCSPPR